MRLGLREANQRFSSAIRAVREGEEVIITDRGRPIAKIVPYRQGRGFEQLVQAGILHPPAPSKPLKRFNPIRLRGAVRPTDLIDDERNA
jgi:prevent-host-death family protein